MKNKTQETAKESVRKKANFFLKKEFILTVLIINIALRLYIAYQPFEFIDGPLVQDDSYYILTIAKNIANGLGPLYTDEYTNGFQPLYVFLIIPVFFITKNDLFAPIRASLVISSIIDSLTLLVLIRLFSKSARSSGAIPLLSVFWIFSSTVITNTLSGLETSMSMFMIVASLYFFRKVRNEKNLRNQIILGIILGLTVLARIDNIFLAASIILFLFIYFKRNKIIKSLYPIIVASVIIYLPWVIYSYVHTGDVFPVSGKALRLISYFQVDRNPTYENWYSLLLASGIKIIHVNNFIPLYLFGFSLIIVFLLKKKDGLMIIFKELSAVNVLIISNLILFLSYVFYFFGYWYFSRYFYPMTLMFVFLAVISFDYINTIIKNSKVFQIVVILAVIGVSVSVPEFSSLFYDSSRTNTGFMNLGLWASRSFKEGTVIGVSQSGAVGYFANKLKVINLDGVVNKDCYLAMEEKRYFDYIKSKKVEFIIGWPSNFTLIRKNSTNVKESNFEPLGKIAEFKTMNSQWTLVRVIY